MNGHATESTPYDFSCEDLRRVQKHVADWKRAAQAFDEEPHPGILKFSTSPLHSEAKSTAPQDVRRKVITCGHYRN